ncbi:MAG: energy-coupling factor transporter ATPase [Chloroflexi bacterium]|nr:energy-coupling factor transporter ATPase [Chloroflexota bacterium]
MISLQNVNFQYSSTGPSVINDVSLSIGESEVVLLIGATGSGKSTLLQIIAGVAPHVTGGTIGGQVTVAGQDVLHQPGSLRGKVGLVLQDPEPQLISLTVEDEVAFGPENLLLPKDEILSRVDWVLRQTRLEEHRHAFVYALSGGQKQRIAIAAGLAMKPEILLLDGPLTNLDPVGATEVLDTITEMVRSQITKTIVIASNKIDALLPLATRIIVMDGGQIVYNEPPEIMFQKYLSELVQMGLFIPEVVSVWPIILEKCPNTPLPMTVEQAFEPLLQLHPVIDEPEPAQSNHSAAPVVEVKDIHFSYGTNEVLCGVKFSVRKAEFQAIVGQNGSGKSTLMSIITGIRVPTKGSVDVLGNDTTKVSPRGHVGYVFQYPEHQFVTPTVGEELRYGLSQHLSAGEIENRVAKVLQRIGMEERVTASPYTLSVGEKRMLSVATMLVMQPEILILDEPTTGLDRNLTVTLMEILRTYVNELGMTVIQVSHDMEQVAEYCSNVVVIDWVEEDFEGTPRELFSNAPVLAQSRLTPPPIFRLGLQLFPHDATLPVTVNAFTKEVRYAGA